MSVLGAQDAMSFPADPDIKEWSDRVALNPARIPPGHPGSAASPRAAPGMSGHG